MIFLNYIEKYFLLISLIVLIKSASFSKSGSIKSRGSVSSVGSARSGGPLSRQDSSSSRGSMYGSHQSLNSKKGGSSRKHRNHRNSGNGLGNRISSFFTGNGRNRNTDSKKKTFGYRYSGPNNGQQRRGFFGLGK
uniref:Uncharacterized protein n=1 Tax=Strongyloides papillosus TaxID=174720 RepID=A0A0N5B6Z8_STREA